jgi:hypothetical protein
VQRLTDPDGETVGFRMMKLTDYIVDGKVYDIDVCCGPHWLCDCSDAQFQNRECKHVRSLRAAMASHGIKISTPKPQPTEADFEGFDDPSFPPHREGDRPAIPKQPRNQREAQAGEWFAGNDFGAARGLDARPVAFLPDKEGTVCLHLPVRRSNPCRPIPSPSGVKPGVSCTPWRRR